MGILTSKEILIAIVFFLCSCGVNMSPIVQEKKAIGGEFALKNISGPIPFLTQTGSEELQQISLTENGNRPTILLFSKYQCGSCIEEHKLIRDSLKNVPNYKNLVNIYTFIVDGNFNSSEGVSKAQEWKNRYALPWPLSVDPNQILFKRYCSDSQTPCTVVFNRQNYKVYSHIGRVPLSELQKQCGVKWYDGNDHEDNAINQAGALLGSELTGHFTATNDGGQSYYEGDLSQNSGKKSLLLISSLGCYGCEVEHEELLKESDWPQKYNIYTLLLNGFADDPYEIEEWWSKFQHPWPLVIEPTSNEFYQKVNSIGLEPQAPMTFIYDENNKLIYLHSGEVPLSVVKEYLNF